jgi:flagellar basal body-associated protein FliL
MAKLTRRKLITQVSVGAGATGALAITASYAFLKTTSNSSANAAYTPKNTNAVYTPDEPLAVFVTDPASGTLKIMKGDREITINNPGLAQSLLSLV